MFHLNTHTECMDTHGAARTPQMSWLLLRESQRRPSSLMARSGARFGRCEDRNARQVQCHIRLSGHSDAQIGPLSPLNNRRAAATSTGGASEELVPICISKDDLERPTVMFLNIGRKPE
ncbi:hypothetical protein ATANTOWER_019953 [Ataeniobius toweri]|uniref:Uncharacterized protein n=1 Tax=Ataeniobius toweri TaxID=208326 RepID=A0ABU7A9S9_9TELE|nr:hypothetical protein [Ataeniobius toweri]